MKIGIVSDIHTEFWTKVEFDVIGKAVQERLQAAERLFPGKPVCLVAGNHEFYGKTYAETISEIGGRQSDNVRFLDRGVFYQENIRVIGATLWTDFNLFGTQFNSMIAASTRTYHQVGFTTGYPDFCYIMNEKDCVSSDEMLAWHERDKQWLFEELAKPFDGYTIVMTHHAPVSFANGDKFKFDRLSPCFASRLEDKLLSFDPALVVWGHTHLSVDRVINETRFVSEPVGYVGKKQEFDQANRMRVTLMRETQSLGTIVEL